MKKGLLVLSSLAILGLISCSGQSSRNNTGGTAQGISTIAISEISDPVNTGDFSCIASNGGAFLNDGSVYTITKGGTYTLNGYLNGQIIVNAGGSDNVEIVLVNATIENSEDSPIKVNTGNKIEIKAKADSANLIKDNRAVKTSESTTLGEGAISSKVDLTLAGQGTLIVRSSYNNAVHSSKDAFIKNLTLQAEGVNNAIKGKDSVTIESGFINAYSSAGQGLKTDNSDISSSGNQRGTISIYGGTINIDSLYDAIDASYDVLIDQTDTSTSTVVNIFTGKNSSYSSSYVSSNSAKGIKSTNKITMNAGTVTVAASDDGVHANYGTTLQNGSKGEGNINIAGGNLNIASGDDGLHADNTINITGGKIEVTNATEGMESNHIKVSGGQTFIYGTDDGLNASYKINEVPSIDISGGFLDVAVNGGDVDGIDSNGTFTQSGGTVVSRGSSGSGSNMSTALDCDGNATISGGTFIAFNGMEKALTKSGDVMFAGTTNPGSGGQGPGGGGGGPHFELMFASYSTGTFVLSGGDLLVNFSNNYEYSSFMVYSEFLKQGTAYTLSKDSSTIHSWTQGSGDTTIS